MATIIKIVYLILIPLLLYFAFGYARYKYILSHANLDEIKPQDQKIGAGPKLKYIAAGDSTAVGQGASRVEKTYTYRVAEYLAEKNTVDYKNVAVIGAQTQDLIDRQLKTIIDFDPDIVTVSIGANDVTNWVGKKMIVENYQAMIRQLTQNSKAKIYITNVPRFDYAYLLPWVFRQYFDSQARSVNKELLKLETDQVKFIDIHGVTVDNSRDEFHPSDEGYNYWTSAFLYKIKSDYR